MIHDDVRALHQEIADLKEKLAGSISIEAHALEMGKEVTEALREAKASSDTEVTDLKARLGYYAGWEARMEELEITNTGMRVALERMAERFRSLSETDGYDPHQHLEDLDREVQSALGADNGSGVLDVARAALTLFKEFRPYFAGAPFHATTSNDAQLIRLDEIVTKLKILVGDTP